MEDGYANQRRLKQQQLLTLRQKLAQIQRADKDRKLNLRDQKLAIQRQIDQIHRQG